MRGNRNNDLYNISLFNISHIPLPSELTDDIRATTKAYVDSLSENERNRPDSFLLTNDHDKKFTDHKPTNSDSLMLKKILYQTRSC